MWLALLVACFDDDLPPRNCAERRPFWPDRDGDGIGERDAVYVGCEAPEGWVETPGPADTADPLAATGDTGIAPHTGVGGGHTGPSAHSAAPDPTGATGHTGLPGHTALPAHTGAAAHTGAPTTGGTGGSTP
jgi:hypothetical protein